MKSLLLALIRWYQRVLSPRKGYRCAWASTTGRRSCSRVVYRAIQLGGAFRGLAIARRQFARCARTSTAAPRNRIYSARMQRGDCDIGICDVLEFADCCDVCDLFDRRRQRRNR